MLKKKLLLLRKNLGNRSFFVVIGKIQHLLKLNGRRRYNKMDMCKGKIQHLLKLNTRKINLCDFHYTIKNIEIQGF